MTCISTALVSGPCEVCAVPVGQEHGPVAHIVTNECGKLMVVCQDHCPECSKVLELALA